MKYKEKLNHSITLIGKCLFPPETVKITSSNY